MMHICTVATLCFPEKTFPRNYYYCVQDENSLCLCFKNMYRTLFVAIFTSTFIFSMYDHILVCLDAFSHTYRNINISNQSQNLCQGESSTFLGCCRGPCEELSPTWFSSQPHIWPERWSHQVQGVSPLKECWLLFDLSQTWGFALLPEFCLEFSILA